MAVPAADVALAIVIDTTPAGIIASLAQRTQRVIHGAVIPTEALDTKATGAITDSLVGLLAAGHRS